MIRLISIVSRRLSCTIVIVGTTFLTVLKEGSVAFAHRIINDSQVLYHLQQKRQGSIVAKTMCNTATKIYDYGNLLNDYSDVL